MYQERDTESGTAAAERLASNVPAPNVCYKHPTVETSLRCNKCGQYICAKCAVRTPVGYRCNTCVRAQQDVFYSAKPSDYVIVGAVGLIMGGIICFLLGHSLFFAILFSVPAGGLISEVCNRLTGKRRGRYTGYVIGIAVLVGALIGTLPLIVEMLPLQGASDLILFAGPALAAVLVAGAAAGRFALRRI
jgi:hypothetical protein